MPGVVIISRQAAVSNAPVCSGGGLFESSALVKSAKCFPVRAALAERGALLFARPAGLPR
jgi:hypothetical protein